MFDRGHSQFLLVKAFFSSVVFRDFSTRYSYVFYTLERNLRVFSAEHTLSYVCHMIFVSDF